MAYYLKMKFTFLKSEYVKFIDIPKKKYHFQTEGRTQIRNRKCFFVLQFQDWFLKDGGMGHIWTVDTSESCLRTHL